MNLGRLTKLEFFKLIRRKDVWSLSTMIILPLACAISLANHSSFFKWTMQRLPSFSEFSSMMYFDVYRIYIFFSLVSICVAKTLSSEIHDKSIYFYLNRVSDRKKLYLAKNAAWMILMLIVSGLFYLVCYFLFYFILKNTGTTGEVFCYPGELLFNTLQFLQIYLMFVFTVQLTLFLSTYFKTVLTMVISVVSMTIMSYFTFFPGIKYIDPDAYVDLVEKLPRANTTVAIKIFLLQCLVILIYSIVFSWLGLRKLSKTDM